MPRVLGEPPTLPPCHRPAAAPPLQTVEPRPRALLEADILRALAGESPGKTSRERALWGKTESAGLQEVCVPKSIWLHWQMIAL